MSRINGDKARFHRVRKERLARRERQRKMFEGLVPPANTAVKQADTKSKERPA